ncbi:MAG TPA: NifB/NifX family molybdenum-iron cluster-binding protein [Aggregatilineaceae bacterium]|nr:NifB/NifX family molybdenum-iron cluster-binding protein [Aggregatilineaceae bacterium]
MVKIAFMCETPTQVSAHFGSAPLVVVVTVEEGQEVSREVRERGGSQEHEHHHEPGHDHQHDHSHHQHDHTDKFAPLADCQVMIVGGMGSPAMAHANQMGIQVYLTKPATVDEVLKAYLNNDLTSDSKRIHYH